MHEFSPEGREEFELEDLSLEELYASRRLIQRLSAGEGAQQMIEVRPSSRLSPEAMSALTPMEELAIRLEERRQVGRAETYQEIADEIDALIDKKLEQEGFSGLS